MYGFLLSPPAAERYAALIERLSPPGAPGERLMPVVLREGEDEALSEEALAGLCAGFVSPDLGPRTPLQRRFLGIARRAPRMQWLHLGHAGTDAPIYGELMDRGILLTNSSGAAAEPIAQTLIAGLLALQRGFPQWFDAQRRHAWERRPEQQPADLRGQTLVVLGLGAIGTHLARFARPFGLHVIGVRRRPAGPNDGVDEWVSSERLAEALPRAHWLAVTVPLTSQTHHLVDDKALQLLPRGAYVLNVARGAVIDETAMIEALRSGHLAGAYLDVFEEEPLPPDSPLWDMPNVLISPHESARSAGNDDRVDQIFVEELHRWVNGEPPVRVVRDR